MTICMASVEDVRVEVKQARDRGRTIGLVPTMGALHAGHVSLIREARERTGFVVVSIFVNPTQFGPNEDLNRYPRPFEKDFQICREEGADLVFAPSADTMYPAHFQSFVQVERMQQYLEGASRPGHFKGVATVVLKLFNIIRPDTAFFGQKDAQQARLIQQMVRDLNLPVGLQICPTVRELDGLALSSRNQYLDAEQRRNAPILYKALQEAEQLILKGERSTAEIEKHITARIASTPGAVLDYVAAVDSDRFEPIQRIEGDVIIALAVRFGRTRLIDNVLVSSATLKSLPNHLLPAG
jgi:pantoate--beta-alanine ligase